MSRINYTKLKLTGTLLQTLSKRFIAFDTETTGLDAAYNRIIEVGAVLFEDGVPVRRYGSLIHTVDYVPYEAQMVNNISNAMVRKAPEPEKVFGELLAFFGDAMQGHTLLVGHNATFDMKFLAGELSRLGKNADILFADTCALSRIALPRLYSHTQDSVARTLGIHNRCSHRAETDAETCGQIMVKLIELLKGHEALRSETEKREKKQEKFMPDGEARELCVALARRVREEKLEESNLCFQSVGSMIHVRNVEPLFAVKLCKHPYIVAERQTLCTLTGTTTVDEDGRFRECCSTEQKIYGDALRLQVENDVEMLAGDLLVRMLSESAERHRRFLEDAENRWNHMREMELYFRVDPSEKQ